MIVIPIIMLIGILAMTYFIRVNKVCSKIVITYIIVMSAVLFISMLNPVGLHKVSNYTYLLYIASVLCIAIVLLLTNKKFISEKGNKDNNINESLKLDNILKSKLLIVIEIVEFTFLIFYTIKYFKILGEIPIEQIRIARFTLLFNSAFETLFYNYIISGITEISIILLAILLINKKICNWLVALIIINAILYTLIGFGRMTILTMIISIIIGVIITKNLKQYWNKRSILIILISFLIIFVIFAMMIFVRMQNPDATIQENIVTTVKNQLRQILEYPLGSFRMLDNFINNGFEEFPSYTYGRATLAGLEEIILYPFKGIGLEIDSFNNLANDIMSKTMSVGEQTPYYNAFYTYIMNFYLDMGAVGVILFSIVYGLLISLVIRNYTKRKTITSLMLLIYVCTNLIFSILQWPYQGGKNTAILIVLIFIDVVNKIIEKNKIKRNEI